MDRVWIRVESSGSCLFHGLGHSKAWVKVRVRAGVETESPGLGFLLVVNVGLV